MKRDIEKVDSKVFTGKNYYSGSLLFKNNLPIFINKALNDKPPDLQVHMHDFKMLYFWQV